MFKQALETIQRLNKQSSKEIHSHHMQFSNHTYKAQSECMSLSASAVCILQSGSCKEDHQHRVCRRVKANRWHMSQGEVAWRGHRLPEGYALLTVAPVQVAVLVRQVIQLHACCHIVLYICNGCSVLYLCSVLSYSAHTAGSKLCMAALLHLDTRMQPQEYSLQVR